MAWDSGERQVQLQTDSRTALSLIQNAEISHPHFSTVRTEADPEPYREAMGAGDGEIPVELGNLNALQHLNLASNGLSGLIPRTIFNISTMKNMSLFDNKLSGNLPTTLGLGLPNLHMLILWGNNLDGSIPPSISNASNLAFLDLELNSFSDHVPNTIGDLEMLQQLRIWSNPDLLVHPSFLTALTRCNHLEKLLISRTSFQGELPNSIGNLSTSLTKFTAKDCNIRGTIPDGIGNLSNILVIDFSSNRLKGFIPKGILKLKKLPYLNLLENELSGAIPDEICEVTALYQLFLSNNLLSQQIPNCFSNLTSLEYLHLGFNRLNFEIPSSIWELTHLSELILASNFLSGSLPQQALGNLKVLRYMDLSRNELSGNIPASIGGMTYLQNLSLAQNNFQGLIPESTKNMVSLELLDLSDNNLTGVIPKSMESLRYLEALNVSQNGLWGEIPSGGPFANMSSESFLLNPGLCGGLPKFGVQPCPQSKGHNKHFGKLKIAVIVASIVLIVAFASIITIIMVKKKSDDQRNKAKEEESSSALPSLVRRRISMLELQRATNGFDDCNLLGKGSFGRVYKAELADGTNVAVKVFDDTTSCNDTECEVLRHLRHRNLIKIISTCYSTSGFFKALVLEFMPNGSLQKWLYSYNYFLNILQRLDIVIDVASALEYLHYGYSVPIVHCDLKPSNVLLDEDLVARISDFGISKLLGNGDSITRTMTLATIGYMAPEFGMEGIVSTKTDMYSFGILVMEIFTRINPTEESFQGGMDMRQWVTALLPMGATEYADANLLNCDEEKDRRARAKCVSLIMRLALQCCVDAPRERMDIKNALFDLKNIKSQMLRDLHQSNFKGEGGS